MFSNILACLFYLINPLTNLSLHPIQPQERLRPGHNQQPIAPDGTWDNIITGHYGVPPLLKVHDRTGAVKWTWERSNVKQYLPPELKHCLWNRANDATELKWIRNGTSVAAVYSNIAMIVNYTPDNPETDKIITWAVCRDNDFLWNAHTLELLPGNRIAVGTTGQRSWDGILVYDANPENPLVDDPPILQNVTGLRAIHGMIWDETERMLWAVGTDYAADGSDNTPAYGTLQGYNFDNPTGLLLEDESQIFKMPHAFDQETEWGKGYSWWVGPHDLVPVPNERTFLISDDRDLHAFDLETRQWTVEGEAVIDKYMRGFETTTIDRYGYNRAGEFEELPRSDLKSFSLAGDGSFIYVQALYREWRGNHTNIVVNGVNMNINEGDEIYRSRWFADIPGWPKPVD
ncbi:hypothetical protein ASPWEDRAFT_32683 [Aspergillus wentii DTO 134E9]|uniref:Uncharacterized protein n=1 Tax=Aspergillus wentii DTO 134E9 TaxID=1073089 RepID=A0A1L9R6G3_ASPWE|nr:uncharacterized protein ASPWEDRAFT_32683 [Aspergillus wentii DTO 134E9]KAI9926821.1 hypothetical protein MW887_003917 [Aspergillus wentii]OJJ30511.1 hypothetical protein ASPWEDRAFT_32683 [Aspergillus wentii DTO 134E9]